MKKKLVKVILEYDDKSKKYLDKENLQKWIQANKACASLYHAHFNCTGYEDIKFKKYTKKKLEIKRNVKTTKR